MREAGGGVCGVLGVDQEQYMRDGDGALRFGYTII